MQITNTGLAGCPAQRYQSVLPVPALCKVSSFVRMASGARESDCKADEKGLHAGEISSALLKSLAHSNLQNQVEAIESLYRKTVRQLQRTAQAVAAAS